MDRIERAQMRNPMPMRPLPGQTDAAGWYLRARRSFRAGEHVIKQNEKVPLREACTWRNYRALLSSGTLSLDPEEKSNGKAHADGRAPG
jgi:hypothetical protein